jgi:N-methylhydantoinase A
MVGVGLRAAPALHGEPPAGDGEPVGQREVLFDARAGRVRAVVHRRERLAAGQVVAGPAVIEQLDTTTLIPPGCEATVHATGALVITTAEVA